MTIERKELNRRIQNYLRATIARSENHLRIGPFLAGFDAGTATRLATAGEDMTAKLLDPNTGAEIKALAGHTGSVTGIAFSWIRLSMTTVAR